MRLARARAIVEYVVANASGPAYTAARSDARSTRELAEKARADPVERASFDPCFTFFLGGAA
jgi:hypothetical protein